jgi:hypothetical protein
MEELNRTLAVDNGLEYSLNMLAVTFYAHDSGDVVGAQEMLAFRAPGTAPLLPGWALSDARSQSKALYQAAERGKHGWGVPAVQSSRSKAPPLVNTVRQRRDPKVPKDPKPAKVPKVPRPPGAPGVPVVK